MEGLQAGRILNFMMQNRSTRPLIVTRVHGIKDDNDDIGDCAGVLFIDGGHDRSLLPEGVQYINEATVVVVSAIYDDTGKEPGTWHWPTITHGEPQSIDPIAQVEAKGRKRA